LRTAYGRFHAANMDLFFAKTIAALDSSSLHIVK
jgi:hypothetical protein